MRTVFTLCAALICLGLNAQPVFNADWKPEPGHISKNQITTMSPNIGTPGPNQMWDFSNLVLDSEYPSVDFVYVAPTATPYSGNFPDATVAAEIKIGNITGGYAFYKADGSSLETIGNANDFNVTAFEDSQVGMIYPFNYGDSFDDTYSWVTETYGSNIYLNATSFNTYDAHGTLMLPNGTFTNVARLTQYREERDSFSIGIFNSVRITFDTTTGWISNDYPTQLCLQNRVRTIELESFMGSPADTIANDYDVTFSYDPSASPVSSAQEDIYIQKTKIFVYPTIVSTLLYINYEELPTRKEGNWIIINSQGQQVLSYKTDFPNEDGRVEIDTRSLSSGMYRIGLPGYTEWVSFIKM